jgi:hypothetical protein
VPPSVPHEADIGLFLNIGFKGLVQDLYGIGHVTDAETIGDVTITTQYQLRDPLKKGQYQPRVSFPFLNFKNEPPTIFRERS